jgi:hypothetical protein
MLRVSEICIVSPCACSYGWYFTFVQGFVYLALIRLQGFTVKQMVNPWRTYVRLSAVLMGSNGLTKGSLAFLNYPAQIMFKSTKVKLVSFFFFHCSPYAGKCNTQKKMKNNAQRLFQLAI